VITRDVPADALAKTFEPAQAAYRAAGAKDRLLIDARAKTADWLLMRLQKQ